MRFLSTTQHGHRVNCRCNHNFVCIFCMFSCLRLCAGGLKLKENNMITSGQRITDERPHRNLPPHKKLPLCCCGPGGLETSIDSGGRRRRCSTLRSVANASSVTLWADVGCWARIYRINTGAYLCAGTTLTDAATTRCMTGTSSSAGRVGYTDGMCKNGWTDREQALRPHRD